LRSYIDILLYTQGGKHAASACKGGIYPHKKGSTRKREEMIRGDKHKRKIALGHRGRTRAYETKREETSQKGVTDIKFYNNPFYPLRKKTHCGVTVTKQVLINTTKNQIERFTLGGNVLSSPFQGKHNIRYQGYSDT
jgi:hypothetical protein